MLSTSNTPPARKKGKEKHPQYAIPNKGTNIVPLLFNIAFHIHAFTETY